MTKTLVNDKIMDYLKSLGRTEKQVAESLKKAKIKGEQTYASFCPLAMALKKKFPKLAQLEVDYDEASYLFGVVPLPKACANFVSSFDDNKYPDLIDPDNSARKVEVARLITKHSYKALKKGAKCKTKSC